MKERMANEGGAAAWGSGPLTQPVERQAYLPPKPGEQVREAEQVEAQADLAAYG